ncbi:MAG: Panacea domain-containing protein [Acidobacteriaceae bacterium]
MTTLKSDDRKLAELILYISMKCANDPSYGATKLNKILYFSDFLAYGKWGKSITNAEYQRLPQGPAPKRLVPVRQALEEEQALVIQPIAMPNGYIQKRPVNRREPNLTGFEGKEIAWVDEVIDALKGLNAIAVSELSHQMVGWKMTKDGGNIPYGTIFLSDEPPTEAEIFRAQEIARQRKLAV